MPSLWRRAGKHGKTREPERPRSVSRRLSGSSPARSWRGFIAQVWQQLFEDEVFGRAAQLAYYWLFSLFPLLIFLTALLAFLPLPKNLDHWLTPLSTILPPEAYLLVRNTLAQITSTPRSGLLSFSILIAVWAASSGMEAIITSLNIALDAPMTRSWWKEKLLAILLTLGLAVFILSALTLIFFGETISISIARQYGLGATFTFFWTIAQWPLTILLVLLALELIYYFAPNIQQRWELFTPGALFAIALWLLISFGFRFYVSRFGNYNATYGALGAVMVLMLWLYLTGLAILLGGEINSVLRKR